MMIAIAHTFDNRRFYRNVKFVWDLRLHWDDGGSDDGGGAAAAELW